MSFLGYYMPGLPRTIADEPDMALVERIRESVGEDNGQTLHSSMLLPCPFCGHVRPFVKTGEAGGFSMEARVVCPCCHAATSSECMPWRQTYLPTGEDITRLLVIGMAISSWNRREGGGDADLIEPEEPTCRWVSVDDRLPECRGEYIVAYHPCYHRDVDESKTRVGIDSFRGKSSWAKRKYQRVTHWMEKPEPPKAVDE